MHDKAIVIYLSDEILNCSFYELLILCSVCQMSVFFLNYFDFVVKEQECHNSFLSLYVQRQNKFLINLHPFSVTV